MVEQKCATPPRVRYPSARVGEPEEILTYQARTSTDSTPELKVRVAGNCAACPQRRELWLLATQHLPSELRVLGHGRCRAQAASLRVTRLSTAFKPHRDPRG